MIKTKQELMDSIKERFGEDTSDEVLTFLGDLSDTFDDMENKSKNETKWEQKYKDNDAEWRKKYRDRFFNGGDSSDFDDDDEEEAKALTFENLFKGV